MAARDFAFVCVCVCVRVCVKKFSSHQNFYRKFPSILISRNGVWLLILLLFTDVVNTSVSILNCPILRDSDGHKEMVRYYSIDVFLFVYCSSYRGGL